MPGSGSAASLGDSGMCDGAPGGAAKQQSKMAAAPRLLGVGGGSASRLLGAATVSVSGSLMMQERCLQQRSLQEDVAASLQRARELQQLLEQAEAARTAPSPLPPPPAAASLSDASSAHAILPPASWMTVAPPFPSARIGLAPSRSSLGAAAAPTLPLRPRAASPGRALSPACTPRAGEGEDDDDAWEQRLRTELGPRLKAMEAKGRSAEAKVARLKRQLQLAGAERGKAEQRLQGELNEARGDLKLSESKAKARLHVLRDSSERAEELLAGERADLPSAADEAQRREDSAAVHAEAVAQLQQRRLEEAILVEDSLAFARSLGAEHAALGQALLSRRAVVFSEARQHVREAAELRRAAAAAEAAVEAEVRAELGFPVGLASSATLGSSPSASSSAPAPAANRRSSPRGSSPPRGISPRRHAIPRRGASPRPGAPLPLGDSPLRERAVSAQEAMASGRDAVERLRKARLHRDDSETARTAATDALSKANAELRGFQEAARLSARCVSLRLAQEVVLLRAEAEDLSSKMVSISRSQPPARQHHLPRSASNGSRAGRAELPRSEGQIRAAAAELSAELGRQRRFVTLLSKQTRASWPTYGLSLEPHSRAGSDLESELLVKAEMAPLEASLERAEASCSQMRREERESALSREAAEEELRRCVLQHGARLKHQTAAEAASEEVELHSLAAAQRANEEAEQGDLEAATAALRRELEEATLDSEELRHNFGRLRSQERQLEGQLEVVAARRQLLCLSGLHRHLCAFSVAFRAELRGGPSAGSLASPVRRRLAAVASWPALPEAPSPVAPSPRPSTLPSLTAPSPFAPSSTAFSLPWSAVKVVALPLSPLLPVRTSPALPQPRSHERLVVEDELSHAGGLPDGILLRRLLLGCMREQQSFEVADAKHLVQASCSAADAAAAALAGEVAEAMALLEDCTIEAAAERAAITSAADAGLRRRRVLEQSLRKELQRAKAAHERSAEGVAQAEAPPDERVVSHMIGVVDDTHAFLAAQHERLEDVLGESLEIRRRLLDALAHLEATTSCADGCALDYEERELIAEATAAAMDVGPDIERQRHLVAERVAECHDFRCRLAALLAAADAAAGGKGSDEAAVSAAAQGCWQDATLHGVPGCTLGKSTVWRPAPTIAEESPRWSLVSPLRCPTSPWPSHAQTPSQPVDDAWAEPNASNTIV